MRPCLPTSALSLGSGTHGTLINTPPNTNLFSSLTSHQKADSGQQRGKRPLEDRAGGGGRRL